MIKKTIKKNTKKIISKVDQKTKNIAEVGKSGFGGFVDFIRTQGVVGLAVGLILGSSISTMVKSLIDDVVMPPLGFLLGSAEGLKGLSINLGTTRAGEAVILSYGVFLNDFINFIIIALVVYFVIKLLHFDKIDKKKES